MSTTSQKSEKRRVSRYLLVGVGNTLFDLVLFTTLSVAVGLAPLVANAVSTVVVMVVSFFINRAWVFESRDAGVTAFLRFAGVTLFTGLVVQSGVIAALLALAGEFTPTWPTAFTHPVAKVCAMGTGMVVNYLGYRWLFRARGQADDRPAPSAAR